MSQDKEKIEISQGTREFIVDTLVEPYYKDMVKTTIDGKKWWRNLGITLETASKIMVALGGIFSFSAGYYHDDTLSFVSGSISCMSLALLQIASFSYKENKKQGDELNILLKKLNLDTVPSMPRSEDQSTMFSARESPRRVPYKGPNTYQEEELSPSFNPPPIPSVQHVSFANPLVSEKKLHLDEFISIAKNDLHEITEQIREQDIHIENKNQQIDALEEENILMRQRIIQLTDEHKNINNYDIEKETYML